MWQIVNLSLAEARLAPYLTFFGTIAAELANANIMQELVEVMATGIREEARLDPIPVFDGELERCAKSSARITITHSMRLAQTLQPGGPMTSERRLQAPFLRASSCAPRCLHCSLGNRPSVAFYGWGTAFAELDEAPFAVTTLSTDMIV